MPIIRKLVEIGNSRAVFLPKSWLEYFEKQYGMKIEKVLLEVDRELKILPYLPKRR